METIVSYEELLEVLARTHKEWYERPRFDDARDGNMKESGPWFPAFLSLMWLTGGRVSEVLELRGIDIDAKQDKDGEWVARITLNNKKQRGSRNKLKTSVFVIDKYSKAWRYVEKYTSNLFNENGLLFHRSRKTVWYHCNRIFGFGAHKAGRHSWAMTHARQGSSLWHIKQMGGWSSLDSMNAYIHEFGVDELVTQQKKLWAGGTDGV